MSDYPQLQYLNFARTEDISWGDLIKRLNQVSDKHIEYINAEVERQQSEEASVVNSPLVESLVEKLLEHDSKEERRAAAEKLGSLGKRAGEEGVQGLALALHNDPDRGVRIESAEALGKIADPRALDSLIAALNDEEDLVVSFVIRAMGEIKDPRIVEPLLDTYWGRDHSEICEILGELGDTRATKKLLRDLNVGEMRERKNAAKALAQIADPESAKELVEHIGDADVNLYVKQALARIGKSTLPYLFECLDETENVDVVRHAEDTLSDHKLKSDVKTFVDENIGIKDNYLRSMAVRGLAFIDDRQLAITKLTEAINDEDSFVRESAVKAIMDLRLSSEGIQLLQNVIHDDASYVRKATIHALESIGYGDAIELLGKFLNDDDKEIQAEAVSLLKRINSSEAKKVLG